MKNLRFLFFVAAINFGFYNFISAQSIQSVFPAQGYPGQVLSVDVTGQSTTFISGTTITTSMKQPFVVMSPIVATSNTLIDNTHLTAYFTLPVSTPLGYYDVTVTKGVPPTATTYSLVGGFLINLTGISEVKDNNEGVLIYPIPSKGVVYITISNLDLLNSQVVIYDIKGAQIFKESTIILETTKTKIDLTGQESGVYFLQIKGKQGTITQKIYISQ